MMSQNIMASQW